MKRKRKEQVEEIDDVSADPTDQVDADPANQVDDFYFSALPAAAADLYPISDEKYAEELQLQEVLIMSASIASRAHHEAVALSTPPPASTTAAEADAGPSTSREIGSTSSSPFRDPAAAGEESAFPTFCKICMDTAPPADMFTNSSCSHSFCRGCLSRHIGAKIQENIHVVRCPEIDCTAAMEPELCQGLIPAEVFERWQTALCEAMVLGFRRTYCPFKDCSAVMIDDGEGEGAAVTQAECPSCSRLFCAACRVGWHAGVSCEEFQRLGADEREREDLQLMEVAKSNSWMRCPRCKFYVEKTQGCLHITCRCGFPFCYKCGSTWALTHPCLF